MDSNNFTPNQQPGGYQQPIYNQPVDKPVSIGDWVLTIFLLCIPIVGLILLFVWAFGSNTPKSKSNFAKAQLIWILIDIILVIFLYFVLGVSLFTMLSYY